MNDSKRLDLINGLKSAMEKDKKEENDRLVFDSVSIEKHQYARLVDIKNAPTEEQLFLKYPDAYPVKELINALSVSNETTMKKCASVVHDKFIDATVLSDDSRVAEISKKAAELNIKLKSASMSPQKMALIYMLVDDAVKKM